MVIVLGNSLQASIGSLILCLHDHFLVHLSTSQHLEENEDCHGHASETDCASDANNPEKAAFISSSDEHCVDISVHFPEELIQTSPIAPAVKKPVILTQYIFGPAADSRQLEKRQPVTAMSRAPPLFSSRLAQCVETTVLRV